MRLIARTTIGLVLSCAVGFAQQPIGTVPVNDATLTGTSQVSGGRATLQNASSVTARDHTAEVTLSRGGVVRVCQTSGVKLSSGISSGAGTTPLMVALESGAIEVKTEALANDIILTPDLRFALARKGPIDLRIRVTRNGDTCVEQHSANAPTLILSDPFGETTYEVHAGQHLLFEHGSLREVVDHESSPCGCPEPARTVSLAEAALAGPAAIAAAEHPFPAAESAGLAPMSEIPQAPAGALHTQVAATLGYQGADSAGAEPPPMPINRTLPASSPNKAEEHGFGHSLKHFFRRVFGRS